MRCPCQSNLTYENCCYPLIHHEKNAETPEQLMRSRFTAYYLKNAEYLVATYSLEKQRTISVEEIRNWAEQCHWTGLEIEEKNSSINANKGYVTFKAFYIQDNSLNLLHEKSEFILQNGLWRYQTGEIIEHVELRKLQRNDRCPCNSGKKFKQCNHK